MWLCLSDAFLSIIQPTSDSDTLRVRARREGDIEKVFPNAKVDRTPGRDYLFRAHVSRQEVADALAAQANQINYSNFKDSVGDHALHDAFSGFWSLHSRLQVIPPYSTTPRTNLRKR